MANDRLSRTVSAIEDCNRSWAVGQEMDHCIDYGEFANSPEQLRDAELDRIAMDFGFQGLEHLAAWESQ